MKVAIIGGRDFKNYDLVIETLKPFLEKITEVVSGGAMGADLLGEKWANEHNKKTLIFLPNWEKYGKSAGYVRNIDIISNADEVFAFWDGKSRGTQHSINIARKENKPLHIVNY